MCSYGVPSFVIELVVVALYNNKSLVYDVIVNQLNDPAAVIADGAGLSVLWAGQGQRGGAPLGCPADPCPSLAHVQASQARACSKRRRH